MEANWTFKKHYNRCIKKTSAAEAQLRSLKQPYGVVPACVRAVHIACVQAIALYGSELW